MNFLILCNSISIDLYLLDRCSPKLYQQTGEIKFVLSVVKNT